MKLTDAEEWVYCERALTDVSRTFSKPIRLLPDQLRVALTCGYLLCRVADTVEDHPELSDRQRDVLFSRFIDVLDGRLPPEVFSSVWYSDLDHQPEVQLVKSLARVMHVFGQQDVKTVRASLRWLTEMTHGMRLYCHRDRSGVLRTIETVADLERYCYFVAGTVGHLVTDLFCAFIGGETAGLERELRARCESFGIGLQLVNIVKDISDDFEHKRCFIPRQSCRAHGFEPEQLLLAQHRPAAHRALIPVLERAAQHLDSALAYTLLLPAQQVKLRMFCLLPLWMAMETLVLLVGNDAVFEAGQSVKISREAVDRITRDCAAFVSDSASIRNHFSTLVTRFRDEMASMRARAAAATSFEFSSPTG